MSAKADRDEIERLLAALAAANERAEKAETWMRLLIAQCRDRGRIHFTADGEMTITEAADAALRPAAPPEAKPSDFDQAVLDSIAARDAGAKPLPLGLEERPGWRWESPRWIPTHAFERNAFVDGCAHDGLDGFHCGQPESAHRQERE